jgi:hypothetical protein
MLRHPRRSRLPCSHTSSLYAGRTRRQLQEVAATGLFTGLWSPWIIAELNRILTWRWITTRMPGDLSIAAERACADAANNMMAALLPTFEVVARARLTHQPGPPCPIPTTTRCGQPQSLGRPSTWCPRTRATTHRAGVTDVIRLKASRTCPPTTFSPCCSGTNGRRSDTLPGNR